MEFGELKSQMHAVATIYAEKLHAFKPQQGHTIAIKLSQDESDYMEVVPPFYATAQVSVYNASGKLLCQVDIPLEYVGSEIKINPHNLHYHYSSRTKEDA